MSRQLMFLTLGLLGTGAVAAPVPRDAVAAITRANDAWLPAMKAHDATAIAEPYAAEAVLILADGSAVTGLPAIKAFLADRIAKIGPVVGGGLMSDDSSAVGDLVYEWGHGSLTIRDARGELVEGRPAPYLSVWKRGTDGRWRITRNLAF